MTTCNIRANIFPLVYSDNMKKKTKLSIKKYGYHQISFLNIVNSVCKPIKIPLAVNILALKDATIITSKHLISGRLCHDGSANYYIELVNL